MPKQFSIYGLDSLANTVVGLAFANLLI